MFLVECRFQSKSAGLSWIFNCQSCFHLVEVRAPAVEQRWDTIFVVVVVCERMNLFPCLARLLLYKTLQHQNLVEWPHLKFGDPSIYHLALSQPLAPYKQSTGEVFGHCTIQGTMPIRWQV